MPIISVRVKHCGGCGIRALVINNDYTLIDEHRRRNHPDLVAWMRKQAPRRRRP